ncbi:MAG: NYN domain-containing protein [bacterium]
MRNKTVRTFLIDGYNLLHLCTRRRLSAEEIQAKREELIWKLIGASAGKKVEFYVVFDGSGHFETMQAYPGVRVEFAPSADERIRRIIIERQEGRELVVVSSDRKDIGNFAVAHEVEWMTSQQFLKRLNEYSTSKAQSNSDADGKDHVPAGWKREYNDELLRIFTDSQREE